MLFMISEYHIGKEFERLKAMPNKNTDLPMSCLSLLVIFKPTRLNLSYQFFAAGLILNLHPQELHLSIL